MMMLPIFAGLLPIVLLLLLSVGILTRLFPHASLDGNRKNR
ncbi:hypothetical protein [Nodosilinea nodulosa]|nr:hypothetical protein [Nodosilinea nodulosa]